MFIGTGPRSVASTVRSAGPARSIRTGLDVPVFVFGTDLTSGTGSSRSDDGFEHIVQGAERVGGQQRVAVR